jgi:hypothetical protein
MSSLTLLNQALLSPGILSGSSTSSATADVTITFANSYTIPPSIFISISSNTGALGYVATLSTVNTTNFTVSIETTAGVQTAVAFNWLAVGRND